MDLWAERQSAERRQAITKLNEAIREMEEYNRIVRRNNASVTARSNSTNSYTAAAPTTPAASRATGALLVTPQAENQVRTRRD